MSNCSKIEWTEVTWNPTTGCDKISSGCKNCYAEKMAKRLKAMGLAKYNKGFSLAIHEDQLDKPNKMKKPRVIFVNSMSDLFHKDIPFQFIKRVFETMNNTPQHKYQILTKRSERLRELANRLNWTENIWMGVTVEEQEYAYRIADLKEVPAYVRFISFEPLIAPVINIDMSLIHWAIVGGESGTQCRPIHEEWVLDIKDLCKAQNIPFFFKQWGGVNKKKSGRLLQGKVYNEYPDESFITSTFEKASYSVKKVKYT